MQIGVEEFNGSRLKEALEYRQDTYTKLAEAVGVVPSNITKYVNGDLKPSPAVFDQIALYLNCPTVFFLSPSSETGAQEVSLWRSLKSATKRSRKRGSVILEWQRRCYQYLSEHFEYPRFEAPQIDVPDHFSEIDSEFIDNYCLLLRESWGLDTRPISHLVRLLERQGFCISTLALNNKKQDAVSTVVDGIPYILLNSEITSAARIRFNVAHELGHVLLHRSVTQEDLEDNDSFNEIEEQAHYFASSLLLPEKPFASDFWAPTLKCIETIKAKWNVSMQSIMRRALELNLITSSQFSYLNISISRKGWRVKEPLDDEVVPERDRLFEQSVEQMSIRYSVGIRQILDTVAVPNDVARSMLGLHEIEGFEDTQNVVRFPGK